MTLKVNVPAFLVKALENLAVPVLPVFTVEVPVVRPDQVPVTEALDFRFPAASLIVTTAEVEHLAADGKVSPCAVMQQTLMVVPQAY